MTAKRISAHAAVLLAEMAHEVNRSYCAALGDLSHKSWMETPLEIQKSAIQGVRFVLANPELTPEDSHTNWFKFKRDSGWTYGPVKRLDTKEHPSMVPYSELPVAERAKDHIFRQTVIYGYQLIENAIQRHNQGEFE